jgi:hypothetical protein
MQVPSLTASRSWTDPVRTQIGEGTASLGAGTALRRRPNPFLSILGCVENVFQLLAVVPWPNGCGPVAELRLLRSDSDPWPREFKHATGASVMIAVPPVVRFLRLADWHHPGMNRPSSGVRVALMQCPERRSRGGFRPLIRLAVGSRSPAGPGVKIPGRFQMWCPVFCSRKHPSRGTLR